MVGIHLPENRKLVFGLKKISQVVSLVTLGVMIIFGLVGLIEMISVTTLGFVFLVMAFIVDEKMSMIFGGLVFLTGLTAVFGLVAPVVGGFFTAMGISFAVSQSKVGHRFQLVQSIYLLLIVVSGVVVLGFAYKDTGFNFMSAGVACLFGLTGIVGIVKWPNRGFMGIFCADTTSTKYALRILVLKIGLIFVSSLLILAGVKGMIFFVVFLAFLSVFLAWFNIKLLYKFELEHFLMKEALRVNNISIQMSMEELEKEKGKYVNKLNYQDKYREMAESLG